MEDVFALTGVLTIGLLYLIVLVKMKKNIEDGNEIQSGNPILTTNGIFINMACHYLSMKDSSEFYSRLKGRDSDLILKMVKCVLSAYKRGKSQIDIFDISFKNTDQLTFTIEKVQYKELLGNCMKDLIEMEEYEMCGEIKKILEGKKRGRKAKTEVL